MSPRWRHFAPIESVTSLGDVGIADLTENAKRLVLLDADNTLLPWRSEDVPGATLDWIAQAKQAGIQLCLVSNTRNRERLARLSESLGIPFAEGKFKPSREMYVDAMRRFDCTPEQTLMIGDQILTDVWGANRAGIDSVLVRPMGRREFIGTKFNRLLEKLLWRKLRDAMDEELDDLPIVEPTGFFRRRIVRQLFKFGIVGLTSFAIDYNIRMTLQFHTTFGDRLLSEHVGAWLQANLPLLFGGFQPAKEAFFPLAVACGASVAIVNSFIWNRMWTFGVRGKQEAVGQFGRFLFVSLMGMLLNVLFSTLFLAILPFSSKDSARVATVLATLIVAIWNFGGQRLFAFRAQPVSE